MGINDDPVTIKAVELAIINHAWAQGWIAPEPPTIQTGKEVAVIGSGPAGLAAAQQLARAGHEVTVFERDDRIGGLLRYGIPEFKMEKHVLDRRLKQLEAEGVIFKPSNHVGADLPVDLLRAQYDALLLAGGAPQARDLPIPGRKLQGVHFAMEYLTMQNRRCAGDRIPDDQFISAEGRNVVIIGGGDTGADCLGTVHRQGAKSAHQLDIEPSPPEVRTADNPWPEWPYIFRTSAAHEEGGERLFLISTRRFIPGKNGRVGELELVEVEKVGDGGRVTFNEIPDTSFTLPCTLALIAIGFSGPERGGMLEQLDIKFTDRGNVWHDNNWMTNVDGVFTAGDMQHGQSLIVWAIAEGRAAAHGIDNYLMGESDLPAPL